MSKISARLLILALNNKKLNDIMYGNKGVRQGQQHGSKGKARHGSRARKTNNMATMR